jgi:hypothetical protein
MFSFDREEAKVMNLLRAFLSGENQLWDRANGRLLALPTYIGLGCKWMTMANILAYNDMELIKTL